MGKLIEKLEQVGQSGGGGFGFMGVARGASRPPRPAAILVSVGAGDTALAEAALDAGADGVVITSWTPASDTKGIAAAVDKHAGIWGVEFAADGIDAAGVAPQARDTGAAFLIVAPETPAAALLDEVERFDVVITVDPPKDDLSLIMMRAENLIPAQAALVRFNFSGSDLARLTVAEFARLRLICESIRFPRLITLQGAASAHARLLIRLGADALVLAGQGLSGEALAGQVKAFREELEKTPPRRESGASISLSGTVPTAVQATPGQPKPERDPEHE